MSNRQIIRFLLKFRRTTLITFAVILVVDALLITFASEYRTLCLAMGIINFIFSSMMMSGQKEKDFFNWKYLQSLPVPREKVPWILVMGHFINFFPVMVLYFISPFLFGQSEKDSNLAAIGAVIVGIPGGCISAYALGLFAFYKEVSSVRAPFLKVENWNAKIHKWQRILAFGFLLTSCLAILRIFLDRTFELPVEVEIGVMTLIAFLLAPVGVYLLYKFFFVLWRNEKLSYGDPHRGRLVNAIGFLGLCFGIFYALDALTFRKVSSLYGTSETIRVMLEEDHQEFVARLPNLKVNETTKYGYTPLMVAAAEGDLAKFILLRQHGARRHGAVKKPDDHSVNGYDLFMLAVRGKNPKIVKYLLNEKTANSWGVNRSALHEAIQGCHPEIIDALIDAGANVNVQTKQHRSTPLNIAVNNGCFSGVVALIDAGASLTIKDKDGKIAKDFVANNRPEIKAYIERKSRRPASVDKASASSETRAPIPGNG